MASKIKERNDRKAICETLINSYEVLEEKLKRIDKRINQLKSEEEIYQR